MNKLGETLGRAYSFDPKTGTEREMLKAVNVALSDVCSWDQDARKLLIRLLIARSFAGKVLKGSAAFVFAEKNAMMEEMGLQGEDARDLDFDKVITSVLQGRLKLERQTS